MNVRASCTARGLKQSWIQPTCSPNTTEPCPGSWKRMQTQSDLLPQQRVQLYRDIGDKYAYQ